MKKINIALEKMSALGLPTVVAILVALTLFLAYFYRDPERNPPQKENVVVSPADGKIIYVREIRKGEILWSRKGNKKILLEEIVWDKDLKFDLGKIFGVYMSPFDVHVNRSPIQGKVVKIKHFKGKRLRLGNIKSEFLNKRTVIVIEHPKGFQVAIVQIAALIVGKIECYVKEGDMVKLGQRIGRIVFGSQVDLIIPSFPNLKTLGKNGEKVFAGETVLAEF